MIEKTKPLIVSGLVVRRACCVKLETAHLNTAQEFGHDAIVK